MRMILTQMLKECGFEVVEAKHGKEALVCLESHPDTSLALIDWNMPEMNGLELLEALKADGRYGSLRRMMVTTESEMSNIAKAMDAGASEYVMKPFTVGTIQDKLRVLGLLS